jgi:competence ComEA-like helix-hairpin-helix protein
MKSFTASHTLLLVIIALAALAFHTVKHFNVGEDAEAIESSRTTLLAYSPERLQELPPRKRLLLGIPVSVNNITAEDLRLIPGISTTLASRIVDYRRRHGPFERWSQLDQVHGIGPRTLEKLQPYLRINSKSKIRNPNK